MKTKHEKKNELNQKCNLPIFLGTDTFDSERTAEQTNNGTENDENVQTAARFRWANRRK